MSRLVNMVRAFLINVNFYDTEHQVDKLVMESMSQPAGTSTITLMASPTESGRFNALKSGVSLKGLLTW